MKYKACLYKYYMEKQVFNVIIEFKNEDKRWCKQKIFGFYETKIYKRTSLKSYYLKVLTQVVGLGPL